MVNKKLQLWERFQRYYTEFPGICLSLDISITNITDKRLSDMAPRVQSAFDAMAQLERGAIANPDENRMVGHYWLRNPALAPSLEIRHEIDKTVGSIKAFAAQVHKGAIKGNGGRFKNLLLIGIGGSALGPEFVSHALGNPEKDRMSVWFFDNTDPDGMDRVLAQIRKGLNRTLCVVVSKSGGTKETRNGMLEAEAAYKSSGLDFGPHCVAVTSRGSALDKWAIENNWLERFPMWDWVGGRTSELSAVGLLPAALQGIDIDSMLAGAKACDEITRNRDLKGNPSAQLALAWFCAGNGKGDKNMIILPYKDRLELFSRYLQQLVMESLGKQLDVDGNEVNQGITVFGNKGSTDQHAYVQQLRDGRHDFFVTFIDVLLDRNTRPLDVEPGVTSGDYLHGFLDGTRDALYERGRESICISLKEVSPFTVGVLIALFERAVGLYASLININAYHQPGVQAGKEAAAAILDLQVRTIKALADSADKGLSAAEIAALIGAEYDVEAVFRICVRLAANPFHGVKKVAGTTPFEAKYQVTRKQTATRN